MRTGARTTVVLLAGGLATRLPGKLYLPVGGEAMLVRLHRRLAEGGRPCIVSARGPLRPDVSARLACTVVFDDYPDGGPLGGLASAAARVATPLLFAAGGDVVNLDAAFVDRLEREYDAADRCAGGVDAVLPTWPDGKVEPLAALYAKEAFLRGARAALAAGRKRVTAALEGLRIRPYTVRPEDEALLANVNTPQDYERLRDS